MASLTTTMTLAAASPTVLSLTLRQPSTKEKVQALLRQMRESGLFPEESLHSWEEAYLSDFEDLRTEKALVNVRDALGDLFTDIILSSLTEASPVALSVYADFVTILTPFLEAGETVESFTEMHEAESTTLFLTLAKLNEIEDLLRSSFEALEREAHATSAEMQAFVQTIQARLRALNAQRTEFTEAMNAKLDAYSADVQKLCDSLVAMGLATAETLRAVSEGHAACVSAAGAFADKMALFAKKV